MVGQTASQDAMQTSSLPGQVLGISIDLGAAMEYNKHEGLLSNI